MRSPKRLAILTKNTRLEELLAKCPTRSLSIRLLHILGATWLRRGLQNLRGMSSHFSNARKTEVELKLVANDSYFGEEAIAA